MSSTLFISGFWLGTFKFMFAHWLTYYASVGLDYDASFFEIFIPVQIGATTSMTVFYFSASLVMSRAAKKRQEKERLALKLGKEFKIKKKFTRSNKGIIWIKRSIGQYGIAFFAPLVMSIPIGSVVCAKFYGDKRSTYPIMVMFTVVYSFIMCSWIYFS